MTRFEVFVHAHDDGPGTGHGITLDDGRLTAVDEFAGDVLAGQRRRHPGVSDGDLAAAIDGWSNGWVGIRAVGT